MDEFRRIKRLPPYIFKIVDDLKLEARRKNEDIIDLGMGNPDQGTPKPIIDKLIEAISNPKNHRYSASKGIYKLRLAITDWYRSRYNIELDPDTEAIVTIGAKEGVSHMVLATVGPGDVVFVPNPTYPIHAYSVVIAGGDLRSIPLSKERDFFEDLLVATKQTWPQPKMLIISFPHNPTTEVVNLDFFKKIVEFAKDHDIMVIHDLAYADVVFDGYKAPSFLEIPGAKDLGVEFFSLSKSYNMPGWRVGFAVGNKKMIGALARIKSYLDYGIFQPIQIASIIAMNDCNDFVLQINEMYKNRRDVLVDGLCRIGWNIEKPKATMFVWAKIPESYRDMRSLGFSKLLLKEGKVAVSPGVGFGEYGDDHIRFALVENEHRIRQAIRGIKNII
ncbi:MAG: aminotransferase class I/II-fold pyridoxal phosphate-dependent enzyme [Thermodesulfobacteriota bacterium]|nr:aminotransferase class I/II-fold pyridoxal phosphate-dependent enzyme [Thermodesulfobacteriota bacterium]